LNGRSSPLHGTDLASFLAQLPAKTIARVEVATSPSAKDDPEGTAGIINLVLEQQVELHLSGSVSAGASNTGLRTVSANVGEQRGPVTLFGSYSYFGDERIVTGYRNLTDPSQGSPTFTTSTTHAANRPSSQTATLRSEYRFDKSNAVSFDAIVLDGDYGRESVSQYRRYEAVPTESARFDRVNDQRSRNALQDYALAFRHTGKAAPEGLSTELRITRGSNRVENTLFGRVDPAYAVTEAGSAPERNWGGTGYPSWNLQSDYTRGLGAQGRIEAGVKRTLRRTRNDFAAAALDTATGQTTPEPDRSSLFDYREEIRAGYVVLSRRGGKVQSQAGVRVEQTVAQFSGDTVPRNDMRYASAFPSAAVSWTPTATRQLRLSYARRIARPDGSQRNPVVLREDATHAFVGNPNLVPEHTDAVELTMQETRRWGSVQVVPYLRRTEHALRYVQAIDAAGVTIGTYDNLASAENLGVDLNTTYRQARFSLVGGASVFKYRSDAANLIGDPSVRSTAWSVRANSTVTLDARSDVQVGGSYRSAGRVEGGSEDAVPQLNVAFRRKLWGEQGSVTVRITDPLEITRFGFRTVSGTVLEDSRRGFGRIVAISLSRNFGTQLRLRPQNDPDVQGPPPTVR
jgi:outer membrane receptor protein involved in Fe transport